MGICKRLIDAGSQIDVKNYMEETPEDVARKTGHFCTSAFLAEYRDMMPSSNDINNKRLYKCGGSGSARSDLARTPRVREFREELPIRIRDEKQGMHSFK